MAIGILRYLDREEVNEVVTESRTRGEYLRDVITFFQSGELAADFSEKYPKVDPASLRNSVDQNVKKVPVGERPEYKIVLHQNGAEDGSAKHVVLVNMDVYNLQAQTNEA
jgi:hypothetical protein